MGIVRAVHFDEKKPEQAEKKGRGKGNRRWAKRRRNLSRKGGKRAYLFPDTKGTGRRKRKSGGEVNVTLLFTTQSRIREGARNDHDGKGKKGSKRVVMELGCKCRVGGDFESNWLREEKLGNKRGVRKKGSDAFRTAGEGTCRSRGKPRTKKTHAKFDFASLQGKQGPRGDSEEKSLRSHWGQGRAAYAGPGRETAVEAFTLEKDGDAKGGR